MAGVEILLQGIICVMEVRKTFSPGLLHSLQDYFFALPLKQSLSEAGYWAVWISALIHSAIS